MGHLVQLLAEHGHSLLFPAFLEERLQGGEHVALQHHGGVPGEDALELEAEEHYFDEQCQDPRPEHKAYLVRDVPRDVEEGESARRHEDPSVVWEKQGQQACSHFGQVTGRGERGSRNTGDEEPSLDGQEEQDRENVEADTEGVLEGKPGEIGAIVGRLS